MLSQLTSTKVLRTATSNNKIQLINNKAPALAGALLFQLIYFFLYFLRQFGLHQFIGFPQVFFPLCLFQCTASLHGHPLVAGEVWCLDNMLPLSKQSEIFRRYFKTHLVVIVKACDAKHLFGHHKAQMVFPFYAFMYAFQAVAKLLHFFRGHNTKIIKRDDCPALPY